MINLMTLNRGRPVTADWAAASRSSGLTICCFVLTGRYWIWPSWVTAIWQESQEGEKSRFSYKMVTFCVLRRVLFSFLYLLLHNSALLFVLDNMSICHLRSRQVNLRNGITSLEKSCCQTLIAQDFPFFHFPLHVLKSEFSSGFFPTI